MLLVQLGINSTRDVWKFAKLDSPPRRSDGKCPAAPAAPLPGNVSQNIFAGNFLAPCRTFLLSYVLECHIIYLLFKNFKSILQVDIVFKLILKFITMCGIIRSLKSTYAGSFIFDLGADYMVPSWPG
jgi:hypothetical protein